ncbi:MAG: hypothetical protein KAQ74_06620, partial [Dehalococcoidia bacterium]|nr:hypothetical protein [Dehalococcoidia bacterium]
WLSDFANFYDSTGYCIPSSNPDAHWQDGDAGCDVPCGSITTTPQYPILSIDDFTIPTHSSEGIADREAAISSIKSVLDQNRAIWFAFFVPSPSAWSTFTSFWLNDDEESLITMDSICSGSAPYCGHAVLCVGYNDEDPENSYWVMLNSWGTAGGNRPNGLFRVNMDMDYDCRCGIQSFYWQTLEVSFGLLPAIEVAPSSLSCTVLQNQSEEMDFSISNNGEGPLEYVVVDRADDGVGGTTVDLYYDDGTPESRFAGDTGTRYAVRFSPASYPARLLGADVHLWQESPQWPDNDHEEFSIEVYDDDGPGGIPGTLLGGTTHIPTDWDWCTIDLSALDVNVNEGAIYVAFQYLTDAPDCEALSFDET